MNPDSRKVAMAYALALARFCILWFGTLVIGFFVIVPVLGFRLREGWNLIAQRPRFFILLSLLPFPFIAIGTANEYVKYRIEEWQRKNSKPD